MLRAVYSRRQLLEVMVEFWTDHFNIDQSKADCRWLKTTDDGEIRRHALGKFRDLLAVSAHSPAMLVYLDNATNRKYNPETKTPPNENYARELLELHTLGDTSAYTLGDIQQVARCFTGWSVEEDWHLDAGRFVFRADDHDDGEKSVLGQRIPPGQGQADGEMVIDLLAAHPLTARTISQKLSRYFVGEGGIGRIWSIVLSRNIMRTDGDVRAMLTALFASDEFRTGSSAGHQTSVSLRDFGDPSIGGPHLRQTDLGSHLEAMGQRPFGWAMPDGYPMQTEIWASSLTPRWKFAIDLAQGDIGETRIDFSGLGAAVVAVGPGRVLPAVGRSRFWAPRCRRKRWPAFWRWPSRIAQRACRSGWL